MTKALNLCIIAFFVLISVTAYATNQGKTLRYGGGGNGAVVFDGRIHASKGYVCTDCHNGQFDTHKTALITMPDHFQDKSCFSCHNGKIAFQECASCHRDVPSQR